MPPLFKVSPARYSVVLKDISEGSEPEGRFYIMVAVSTSIACLGLITNSTAVIIGAMLVAPLMTPIFGIALGLIRGDTALLGKSLRAEIAGVVAAVLMGFIFGRLYPALQPTPEMISRTEPQLFDLLVAVFSGFAGAFALVDEKISPALPGVAIATAIVPPLANAGLCFATGAHIGGIGSFLLFFANFLSILLVAAATFWISGMTGRFNELNFKIIFKRFGLPMICFLLVGGFLTKTLLEISVHHHRGKAIEKVLTEELAKLPDTNYVRNAFNERDGTIYVLAEINSSAIMTPTQVSRMQEQLTREIGQPTQLVARSRMVRDISALGAEIEIKAQGLDGSITTGITHPMVLKAKIADTIIRNFFADFVGYDLANVRILENNGIPTVVALIFGISAPDGSVIQMLEQTLRDKLLDPHIELIIRFMETELYGRAGTVHPEFSGLFQPGDTHKAVVDEITSDLKKEIAARKELSLLGISSTLIEDVYHFLVEASGPGTISQKELAAIEGEIKQKKGVSARIFFYLRAKSVVSSDGFESYPAVSHKIFNRQKESYKEIVQEIIEESNL